MIHGVIIFQHKPQTFSSAVKLSYFNLRSMAYFKLPPKSPMPFPYPENDEIGKVIS